MGEAAAPDTPRASFIVIAGVAHKENGTWPQSQVPFSLSS
jgi:hypothetical protein